MEEDRLLRNEVHLSLSFAWRGRSESFMYTFPVNGYEGKPCGVTAAIERVTIDGILFERSCWRWGIVMECMQGVARFHDPEKEGLD